MLSPEHRRVVIMAAWTGDVVRTKILLALSVHFMLIWDAACARRWGAKSSCLLCSGNRSHGSRTVRGALTQRPLLHRMRLLSLLLRNDFARVKLDEHGAVGLYLFDRH